MTCSMGYREEGFQRATSFSFRGLIHQEVQLPVVRIRFDLLISLFPVVFIEPAPQLSLVGFRKAYDRLLNLRYS